MNITIIKSGGWESIHTSFKKACDAYGWDYDALRKEDGVPSKVFDESTGDLFKITKLETDLTIYEQMQIKSENG